MEDRIVFEFDKEQELTSLSNQEYIREWLLKHNEYLACREDCEESLEVLTLFVIIFEKLAGLNPQDVIVKDSGRIRLISGPAIKNEAAVYILKLINYGWAYLEFEQIINNNGVCYSYLKYMKDGIFTEKIIEEYFGEWYRNTTRRYKKCKFDRIVYVVNHKVFYADQPLTDEEIEYISKIKDKNQNRYDVDHHENGYMCCW